MSIDDYRSIVCVLLNREDGALPLTARFIMVELDLWVAFRLTDGLPVIPLVTLLSRSSPFPFLPDCYGF